MFSFTGVFTGCWSKVGRDGGAQPINLHRDCLNKKEKEARRKVKHEILHALGFHHEMNRLVHRDNSILPKILFRPDRDSHIEFFSTQYQNQFSPEDTHLWQIGSGGHNESQVTKLDFNFDILSIMQYPRDFGITSLNDFYNEVGFGTQNNLTATDKIALNVLYDCPDVKRKMYYDFIKEEGIRNYVELMQLKINPNEASKRYLIQFAVQF